MKKFLSLILVFAMLLSMSGCVANMLTDENLDFAIEVLDQIDQALDEVEPEDAQTPPAEEETAPSAEEEDAESALDEHGAYTTKEDVALYIHLYGHLPENFITKDEARKLGWEGGGLDDYAKGKCIGGDRFGNYESLLPEVKGRTYYECDINTLGAEKRGAERIVFSNDGLVYYTPNHYETFELLYGEASE